MIIYTDRVIEKIGRSIASYEPERGGALLGIPNSNLITEFIEDPLADVTHASYFPSKELTVEVNELELRHGLQFKGIIHSHPGNFNVPSGQDENAFALGLSINPRLSGFVAPIVTVVNKYGQYDKNDLKLSPRGQLTSYVAYREKQRQQESMSQNSLFEQIKNYRGHGNKYRNTQVFVEKTPCTIMPIEADTCALTDKLQPVIGEVVDSNGGYLEINGVLFISETYRFDTSEVIILFPPDYPTTKPFILASRISGGVKGDAIEISFPWLFSYSGRSQLADTCGDAIINVIGIKKNISLDDIRRRLLGSDDKINEPPIDGSVVNRHVCGFGDASPPTYESIVTKQIPPKSVKPKKT